jgi:hypothetical protein
MTAAADESIVERLVAVAMLVVFWSAFACLAVGLGLWVGNHSSEWGALLLAGGLLSLMVLPTLRLLVIMVTAYRERDWMLLGATLTVLAILLALTLRDAASSA